MLASLRGGVLPVLVTLAIFGLRPACTRRDLPCANLLLPAAATIELCAAVAADATGSHILAVTAGGAALVVALVAIASVLLRETDSSGEILGRLLGGLAVGLTLRPRYLSFSSIQCSLRNMRPSRAVSEGPTSCRAFTR